MLIRHLAVVSLCLGLAGCQAIEVKVNPPIPRPQVQEERQTTPTSGTTTRALPGGKPLPTAANLVPSSGTLRLTVEGAITVALANNISLKVDEINPAISATFIAQQRAAFDPTLSADFTYRSTRTSRTAVVTSGTVITTPKTITQARQGTGDVGLTEFLPTGTTIGVIATPSKITSSGSPNLTPYSTRVGLSVTQQLLQGAGLAVNLVSLRQAKIDTLSSEYELRGFTQALVAQVEEAYWDYLFAQRQVKIFEDALNVAQAQLRDTQQRIEVGKLAANERFAAESEVASRRETLINGQSQLQTSLLALQRLLTPPGQPFWQRPIDLLSEPVLPDPDFDHLESHVALALQMRPDLNQARLAVKRDELQIVKTKNGLLPALDLFINLGRTGFANSFNDSVENISNDNNDLTAGAQFSYPLGNRAARAMYRQSMLTRDQGLEAVNNLAQLVEVDVRDAYIEVNRLREQVAATAVTRRLQEETLRAEQEKFRVGRSTSLLVVQAERDLLTAQINELQAFIWYMKAIVELYRLDGSLLERRGVNCPGREPVDLTQALPH